LYKRLEIAKVSCHHNRKHINTAQTKMSCEHSR